jgi:hypothetical protein
MYRLNCLVDGEHIIKNIFTVDILHNKSISDLNEAIKNKKQPAFDQFEADKLELKKVEIPLYEGVFVESLKKPQAYFITAIHASELNDSTANIHEIWPEKPRRHYLHVVVSPPHKNNKRGREEETQSLNKIQKFNDTPREISVHPEFQYLNLTRHIIEHGQQRIDRTGTGTRSVFAPNQLRFDLSNDVFPLLTTKRVFFRAVAEELLWMISGDTNSKTLNEKGIKIWNGNGSREYLDKIGLKHREEGDLGPVYGFQWRHFGAEYIDCQTDYHDKGVDQLKEVIHKIKTKPMDRRIIMSVWNPKGTHSFD